MKVAAFICNMAGPNASLVEAFVKGVKKTGDQVEVCCESGRASKCFQGSDVAVQCGFLNSRKVGRSRVELFRKQIQDDARRFEKRLVTIEAGFIHSEMEAVTQSVPRDDNWIHYSVGYDGYNRYGDYCNQDSDSRRWELLGVDLKPWKNGGEHVLILDQKTNGINTWNVDISGWSVEIAKTLWEFNIPIVIRMHPRTASKPGRKAKWLRRFQDAEYGVPVSVSCNIAIGDDLRDARFACAYNSNASVLAAVHGVPVFCQSESAMAWEVRTAKLNKVLTPDVPDRTQWAWNLAYAQWSIAEMKSGACWDHLRPHAMQRPGDGK